MRILSGESFAWFPGIVLTAVLARAVTCLEAISCQGMSLCFKHELACLRGESDS